MRIRALKPGFFKNEELCALSPWHRICFQGLWLIADRDGRLEDRPRRLKAEIFPYDDLDMNSLLWDLMHAGFIVRYSAPNLQPLVWIPSWQSHQFPRGDEAVSKYAAFTPGSERRDGTDPTTFPSARPDERAETTPGQDVTTTVTDACLHRDSHVAAQQIGDGILDLGSGILETGGAAPAACRAQDLLDLWNATTKPPIPRCRDLNDDRRRKIRTRLGARPSLAEWREIFEAVQASAYCRGQNDRSWRADFDWIIKNETNGTRMLERAQTPADDIPTAPTNKRIAALVAGGDAFLKRTQG